MCVCESVCLYVCARVFGENMKIVDQYNDRSTNDDLENKTLSQRQ